MTKAPEWEPKRRKQKRLCLIVFLFAHSRIHEAVITFVIEI